MTTDESPKKQFPELPSPEDFCLSVPLYKQFQFDNDEYNPFFYLEQFEGTLDFYCPECKKHSVFTAYKNNFHRQSDYHNYIFSLKFDCSRSNSHKALFLFRAHNGILQKIGQIPSIADLAFPGLRKYSKVLGDEKFGDLTRAIGLTTHGIGIGAFVYLRRIFESLIEGAHTVASRSQEWNEESYNRARMDEKIEILKDHLPEFLVQNRALYGILSVGVHTLTEKECLDAFPAVRLAIELILDDLIEKRERQTKLKAASKSLSALKTSNSNKKA